MIRKSVIYTYLSMAPLVVSAGDHCLPKAMQRFLTSRATEYSQVEAFVPRQLAGDFDGDGKPDHVIVVKNKKNEHGLLFYLTKTNKIYLLGAGTAFNDWRDLDFNKWQLHLKNQKVETGGVEAGDPPSLMGDALLVVWDEAGSGLIYWDGRKLQWYQQGD